MIDRALADRTAQASEYRIIRPSGEVRWVSDLGQVFFDKTGKPLRMIGIIQDITERKRAEEALRESEEKLRLLFDEAPVGYHEVDTEGRVIRINRTELDLLGYSLEDVIGQPIWRLCVDEQAVIKAFKDKIAGKVPPGRAFERSYRRKDGTPLLFYQRTGFSGIRTEGSPGFARPSKTSPSASGRRRRSKKVRSRQSDLPKRSCNHGRNWENYQLDIEH